MARTYPHPVRALGDFPAGFRHAGVSYNLNHLRSFTAPFNRPAIGTAPPETFSVNVSFSHHCFTRGVPKDGRPWDASLEFTHAGEVRLFDVRRWRLSQHLPGIIASMPAYKCRQTGHGNYFTVALIAEDGSIVEYEVFFRVWKPGRGRVFLHVESAYVRDDKAGRPKGTAVGFFVILHNTLHGRRIHG